MQKDLFSNQKHTIRRFFSMLWKAKLPYVWIILFIAASVYLVKVGIDVTEYTAQMFAGNVSFSGIILPFIIYSVGTLLLSSVNGIFKGICSAKIDRALRRMVWSKTVSLPFGFFQSNDPKELITRITNDISSISKIVMNVFVGFLISFYTVFSLVRQVGSYDPRLMWVMVIMLPLDIIIAIIMGRLNFGINDRLNWSFARLNRTISERVSQSLLIRSFGTQESEEKRVEGLSTDYRKNQIRSTWINSLSSPFSTMTYCMKFILLLLVGRHFYGGGMISLPEWIAFFAFSTQLTTYISSYTTDWINLKAAMGSTERVSEIIDTPSEIVDQGKTVEELSGELRAEDITFGYGDEPLFEHLSVTIPVGLRTALVGSSGSGKTTLLNLFAGLYDLWDGKITVGGENITQYTRRSYRSQLNYITQECTLFSGTLRQNLLYGLRREVGDEELNAACEQAGLLDYVNELPAGYETEIGEGGSALSGGQRQKLSVARMLLKKGNWLFMDEATAAMDASAKAQVWGATESLSEGCTCLFVAHDRQSVSYAQHVIVLEKGRIVDQGPTDEVARRNAYVGSLLHADVREEG